MSNNDPPTHPVVVYHKSPFAAALPWIAGLIFVTLMISPFFESAPGPFELCSMISVLAIFWIALLGILITNEKLGTKITVNQTQSEISVYSRGLRTEFKQDICLEYQNSDCIVNRVRTESVTTRDGGSGTATHYESYFMIAPAIVDGSEWQLLVAAGVTIATGITDFVFYKLFANTVEAQAQHLEQQPPLPESEGDEEIQFGTILS